MIIHPIETFKWLAMIGDGYGVSEKEWKEKEKEIAKNATHPRYVTQEEMDALAEKVLNRDDKPSRLEKIFYGKAGKDGIY